MPTPMEILAGLTETAQRFGYIAVVWHLGIFGLVVALVAGWRPSMRAAATMLVAPLVSVAALALVTWSPFNAAVFSADDGCTGTSTLATRDTAGIDPQGSPGAVRMSFAATG